MKKKLKMFIGILALSTVLAGCGEDECDYELQDFDGDGKIFDAGDYDTMKQLEDSCRE